jgi:hypothetical protein
VGTITGNAPWQDLAALGNVFPQPERFLEINNSNFFDAKTADLFLAPTPITSQCLLPP